MGGDGDAPRVGADGEIVPAPPLALPAARVDAADIGSSRLREWLCASLSVYSYFSCEVKEDASNTLRVFQLLSNPRKLITVNTYYTNAAEQRSCFNLLPLELAHPEAGADAVQVDAFEVSDAQELDLIYFLEGDPAARRRIQVWTRSESDIEGCFLLSDPYLATPVTPMTSASYPLLALHDALDASLHVPVQRKFKHNPRSGLYYDMACEHVKGYLQCVLSTKWLYDNGQATFESRMPNSYYLCILKRPGCSPPP